MIDRIVRFLLAAAGAIPMLVVVTVMILIWIDPSSVADGSWVKLAASFMMLEFLLLHSGAFMTVGPMIFARNWQRWGWFVGFGVVYGGFLFGYSHWTGGTYTLWALLALMAGRMVTMLILRDKRGTILTFQRSILGVMVFMFSAVIVLIPMPDLGLTEDVRYEVFGNVNDVVSRHPERMIAWGVLYFLLMALVEAVVGWNLPDWTDEQVEETWRKLGQ